MNSRSGHFGEEKKSLLSTGIRIPESRLVAIPTTIQIDKHFYK